MRYPNPHETTRIKLSDVTGVLLHFKLLEDLSARLNMEINRKEQWDGASLSWAGESARCLAKLRSEPGLSFYYDGSVGYEDSEQLVRLGLIREDEGWMRIRTAGGRPRMIGEHSRLAATKHGAAAGLTHP